MSQHLQRVETQRFEKVAIKEARELDRGGRGRPRSDRRASVYTVKKLLFDGGGEEAD